MSKFKLIKLDGRHKLYKEFRMTYAWRFEGYDPKLTNRIENFLRENYGAPAWGYGWGSGDRQWGTVWGSPRQNQPRLYWIGVRDPEIPFIAKMAGIDF